MIDNGKIFVNLEEQLNDLKITHDKFMFDTKREMEDITNQELLIMNRLRKAKICSIIAMVCGVISLTCGIISLIL